MMIGILAWRLNRLYIIDDLLESLIEGANSLVDKLIDCCRLSVLIKVDSLI